ncbi:MAG: hypothetical protein ACYDC1_07325 [Limisphaerales bacterium]
MNTSLRNWTPAFVLTAACWIGVTALSAADALPAAKEVFARHLEAIGGRDVVAKLTGMRAKGEFKMPAVGMVAPIDILRAPPNRTIFQLTPVGFGEITGGFDGTTGWTIDPMSGAKVLSGKALDQSRDDAEFFSQFQLHDDAKIASATTVARTPFDGRECVQVKLVWKTGREEELFFDAKTGLLAGVRKVQETEQGPTPVTVTMLDYKKFGPLLQPTRLAQKLGEMDLEITLTEYRFEAVTDAELALPTAVKELLKTATAPK